MTQNYREFELYTASCRGNEKNTSYPFPVKITCIDNLKQAAAFDNIGVELADGKNTRGRFIKAYRSKKCFRRATVLKMDCDNATDNPHEDIPPEKWVTVADVITAFPGVPFYVVYSRNHMKEKNGKPPRPKFHIYFIMDAMTDMKAFERLKKAVREYFPQFDIKALDVVHFFYGVENPQVEYHDGTVTINEFMRQLEDTAKLPAEIPEGQRNGTISVYAARIFKKYGDTDEAEKLIYEANDTRCVPPMDNDEVKAIIESARRFFHNTIEKSPDYISADEYAAMDFEEAPKKKATSDDIKQILARMNIKVRLNVISGMVEIEGMPPQFSKANAVNVLPVLLTDYMTRRKISCSRQTLDDALVLIEDENRFNPIEDMLKATKWDGSDRISEVMRILGIEENKTYCLYLTKWLHQTAALALNDETEPYGADGVLVLQDEQGAGKTLFCSTIAMKADWFAEGVTIDLDKKDTIIQSTGCWIAELGELDSTLKREQSALKAFLTAARDTYRQPYAREATRKPRRTSFCATVNPEEFLNDETGSRRFWVVQTNGIDCERLKSLSAEWTAQLWAQVYEQLYKTDPQGFRLTPEEREQLQRDNEKFSKPLPGEIELRDRLAWGAGVDKWQWCSATTVKTMLDLKTVSVGQLGKVLTKLSKTDSRIQMKAPHNSKQYLLPPIRSGAPCLMYTDDFAPLLSDDSAEVEPLTGAFAPRAVSAG